MVQTVAMRSAQSHGHALQITSNAGPMLPSPITAISGIEHLPQEPVAETPPGPRCSVVVGVECTGESELRLKAQSLDWFFMYCTQSVVHFATLDAARIQDASGYRKA